MLKNVKLRSTKVGLTILNSKTTIEEIVKLNKILLKKGNLKF